MIYEYSRNANKSKVTVSCETVKSRTNTIDDLITIMVEQSVWCFVFTLKVWVDKW